MNALSRRSFFAALAGAPVAAALGNVAPAKSVSSLKIKIDAAPLHNVLRDIRRIEAAWADGYRGSALRTLILDSDVVFDGPFDALIDPDAIAIDSMINEGGRDWS